MKVLIIGAAGMIGRKLTGAPGPRWKTRWQGHHQRAPRRRRRAHRRQPMDPSRLPLTPSTSPRPTSRKLVAPRPDVIFLLASVVSGEAEADFDKGYAINLGGTHAIFEAIRREQALSGGAYKRASNLHLLDCGLWRAVSRQDRRRVSRRSLTSYGTQKAICELWLADYSRRGFFDGVGLRLPTICVRPGLPNKAASGFFSGIIREPLAGKEAILPVGEDVRHWHASPRAAISFLLRAAEMDLSLLGARRSLDLPGVSVTVGEQIEALRAIAGEKTVALIRRQPDETIIKIVLAGRGISIRRGQKALDFKRTPVFPP